MAVLGSLIVVLLLVGCGRRRALRYDDLVTDRFISHGSDPRAELPCDDQTRFVRPLENGGEIHQSIDLGRSPELVLTFCKPERGPGALRLRVTSASGVAIRRRFSLSGPPAWSHEVIDLGAGTGKRVSLTLKTSLPKGGRVLLRDAYIRHWAEHAAGWPQSGVHVEWQEAHGGEPEGPTPVRSAVEKESRSTPSPRPAVRVDGPKILLISIDTLRADMLAPGSPYTPNLQKLAADGEIFTPHHPGASWTKPSHATLLTGYPLSVHGAETAEGVINPAVPTLAERLRAVGLATGGLVHDCVWLNPKFGFARGFDDYRSVKWGTGQIARAAVNWIAAHRGRAFFFFLHTFGVHSDFHRLPYESDTTSDESVESRFGVKNYGCRDGYCASGLLKALGEHKVAPLPKEGRILRYLYAAGVREVDAKLGRLFSDLKAMGLYDQMLIVVTADHGEMLLEHGATTHGVWWNPVITVPLIVKWPGEARAGQRVTVPTSSIDVATTLLAIAGAKTGDLPGADLRHPPTRRPIFVGSKFWLTVYDGKWKGVLETSGDWHLFDLATDPGELHDLAGRRPEVEARLARDISGFRSWSARARRRLSVVAGEKTKTSLTAKERKRLRALGYLQ